MKTILLKIEDELFFKLSSLKAKEESIRQERITWEEFFITKVK